jgi:hypothetical protein
MAEAAVLPEVRLMFRDMAAQWRRLATIVDDLDRERQSE